MSRSGPCSFQQAACGITLTSKWSGREDSNLRPLPPEDSALPG
jgi:hypothetical protein